MRGVPDTLCTGPLPNLRFAALLRTPVQDTVVGRPGRGAGRESSPLVGSPAQYVARPPERSKAAPVVKEFSCDTSQATMAAISSTSTKRLRGIFDSM